MDTHQEHDPTNMDFYNTAADFVSLTKTGKSPQLAKMHDEMRKDKDPNSFPNQKVNFISGFQGGYKENKYLDTQPKSDHPADKWANSTSSRIMRPVLGSILGGLMSTTRKDPPGYRGFTD